MLSRISVKSVQICIFHAHNRRNVLYFAQGGRIGYLACRWQFALFPGNEFCVKSNFQPNYNGLVSSTLHGFTCQRWDSQNPHQHHYTDPDLFPESTLQDAANYCRTPDGKGWPWCLTTSPDVRSQACTFDVKLCNDWLSSGTCQMM